MQINQATVLAEAQLKILELALKVSSKIDQNKYPEDIFIGSKIVALRKVIQSNTSLLTEQEKQTILIAIHELSI